MRRGKAGKLTTVEVVAGSSSSSTTHFKTIKIGNKKEAGERGGASLLSSPSKSGGCGGTKIIMEEGSVGRMGPLLDYTHIPRSRDEVVGEAMCAPDFLPMYYRR